MTDLAALDEYDALLALATPGPWSTPHLSDDAIMCDCGYVLVDGYMGAIATVHSAKIEPDGDNPKHEEAQANGRVLARARNSAPAANALARAAEWVQSMRPHPSAEAWAGMNAALAAYLEAITVKGDTR